MGPDFECWSLGRPPLCPQSLIKPTLAGRLFRFYRASIPFDSVAGLRRRFGGHGAAAETHNSYSDSHSCLASLSRRRGLDRADIAFTPQDKASPFAKMTALDDGGLGEL